MEDYREVMPVYKADQVLGIYINDWKDFSREDMARVEESFFGRFQLGKILERPVILDDEAKIADLMIEVNDGFGKVNMVLDQGRGLDDVLREVGHLAFMAISEKKIGYEIKRFEKIPINPKVEGILEKYA